MGENDEISRIRGLKSVRMMQICTNLELKSRKSDKKDEMRMIFYEIEHKSVRNQVKLAGNLMNL